MSTPLFTTMRASIGALELSVVEASGIMWALSDMQGWGSPKPTIAVTQRPRALGGWAGASYLEPRNLALTGTVVAPTAALLSDAIDRLNAAVSLDDTTLTLYEQGRTRTCTVRGADEVLITWDGDLAAEFSVQLIALDPRKYGPLLTGTTHLPSSSGGLTWPITFPAIWAATQVTGIVTLTNSGSITGPVTLRINGPVTGPSITHLGTGNALTFASSLVLNAGEWLDVDMEARSVLANGQSSRNGWVTSRGWFGLDPGINQFAYNAAAYNSSSTLVVSGYSTWP